MAGFHCQVNKNKNINENMGYARWLIYKQPNQDVGPRGFFIRTLFGKVLLSSL